MLGVVELPVKGEDEGAPAAMQCQAAAADYACMLEGGIGAYGSQTMIITSDGEDEGREVLASPVRQPALPHLLRLRARRRRRRLGALAAAASAEPGDDERGVAVLADAGDAAAGADCPRVHPVQLPRGVRPLRQHGLPEGVDGADLEREAATAAAAAAAAGEEPHEHEMLVRARAVEPPVHVRVQQPPHGVPVAALQRAVQLLHHRLAADHHLLPAAATGIGVAVRVYLVASQLCCCCCCGGEASELGREDVAMANVALDLEGEEVGESPLYRGVWICVC